MKRFVNALFFIIKTIAISLLILTFSISLPIYCRGFYYLHIDWLDLPAETGYSSDIIIEAYDDVLDYLTMGKDFGTGALAWSESGKMHFEDCKVLFDLNLYALIGSAMVLLVCILINRKNDIYMRRRPYFYGGILAVVLPSILGCFAFIDFDSAFTLFHKLFFPGKDNWIFDSKYDEIIEILPSQFFADCGILILISVIVISTACIIAGRHKKEKNGVRG